MTPPIPGSLSPLRWRWILLVTRRQEVRFLYRPPQHPAGLRQIKMYDRQGYDVGQLVWMICDECRIGSINKISIVDLFQRRGLGRRLVRRAVTDGPDYRWRTTGQSAKAKGFFPVVEREISVAFPEYGPSASTSATEPAPTERSSVRQRSSTATSDHKGPTWRTGTRQ